MSPKKIPLSPLRSLTSIISCALFVLNTILFVSLAFSICKNRSVKSNSSGVEDEEHPEIRLGSLIGEINSGLYHIAGGGRGGAGGVDAGNKIDELFD